MAENQNLRVNIIGDSSKLNQALGKAEGRLNKFSKSLKDIGQTLTTRLTLPLAAVGGIAVKQAAKFERLQTTLNVLTGSAEEGAAAFERLVQFSAETPFQLDQLARANNTMMGFGLSAEDAFRNLRTLGDIAAVSGGDLDRIAVAFGQSAAAGRVMNQDLLQFVNNGIPIIDLLAKSMGVATSEIKDLSSQGLITFDVLQKAFEDATSAGGQFEGGMKTLSTTLEGLFSTLQDNVNIALAELGNEIADAVNLQEGIPALTNFIKGSVEAFKSLSDSTQKLIIYLGGAAGLFPLIATFIGTVGPVFSKGMKTILGTFTRLNPIVLAVTTALSAFGLGVEKIATKTNLDFFTTLTNLLKAVGNPFAMAANTAKSLAQNFADMNEETTGDSGFEKINNDLGETVNTGREALSVLSSITTNGLKPMTGAAIQASEVLKKVVEPISTGFSDLAYQLIPQVGQALTDSFAAIAEGESPIKRLETAIKALVVRLMAAAAAAALLSILMPGVGMGKLSRFGGFFGMLTGIQGMASGGLAFGQTPVMVGDYSGVRSNPEVIAPLNKLKTLIDGGGSQNLSGEFVVRGQDLVLALQRAERNRNRFK